MSIKILFINPYESTGFVDSRQQSLGEVSWALANTHQYIGNLISLIYTAIESAWWQTVFRADFEPLLTSGFSAEFLYNSFFASFL